MIKHITASMVVPRCIFLLWLPVAPTHCRHAPLMPAREEGQGEDHWLCTCLAPVWCFQCGACWFVYLYEVGGWTFPLPFPGSPGSICPVAHRCLVIATCMLSCICIYVHISTCGSLSAYMSGCTSIFRGIYAHGASKACLCVCAHVCVAVCASMPLTP